MVIKIGNMADPLVVVKNFRSKKNKLSTNKTTMVLLKGRAGTAMLASCGKSPEAIKKRVVAGTNYVMSIVIAKPMAMTNMLWRQNWSHDAVRACGTTKQLNKVIMSGIMKRGRDINRLDVV